MRFILRLILPGHLQLYDHAVGDPSVRLIIAHQLVVVLDLDLVLDLGLEAA